MTACFLLAFCGVAGTAAQPPTPPEVAAPSIQDIPQLPPVIVEAPPLEEAPPSPVSLAPTADYFAVDAFHSAAARGYSVGSVTVGTLADTPLLSIPQSIGVVTEALIRDQQSFSVSDAFRNVSGVQSDHNTGNNTANAATFGYLIRGFPTTYRRWNGYRSDLLQTSIDTGNIERIEFIKGPASTLYGATDAGGFFNIITKQAQADDFARVGFSGGSFGLARTDVDVNRQIDDDVALRFNVSLQQKDSFRDFVNDDRILLAPSAAVRLTERAVLRFDGEYYSTNTMFDTGIASLNGSFNALPVDRLLMDPTDFAFGDYWKAGLTLEHELSDAWSSRIGYSFGSTAQYVRSHFPVDRVGSQVVQVPVYQTNVGQLPTVLGAVAGTVDVGPCTHHVASSFELEWLDSGSSTEFFFGAPTILDATNPSYSGTFPASAAPTNREVSFDALIWSIQDRIVLSERWELVGGAAFQSYRRSATSVGPFFPAGGTDEDQAWTPRASVIFHPVPQLLSTWYGYSESLFIQSTFDIGPDGRPLAPTAGRQHEIGLRIAPDERWWAAVAVFDLQKSSVPVFTPFGQAFGVDARSQGIEFDLNGALTERLSVTANYAYLDTRVTNDPINTGALGRQVPLVPHNSANAWWRYNFLDESLPRGRGRRTIGIGNGVRWVGASRTLNFPNYFEFGGENVLPSYVTADAGVFSQVGRFFANVYFENLTDVRYYTSGLGAFANPGRPFAVRATLGCAF